MAETEGRTKRRARVFRVVLVVSLALNLLVLGVMAGGLMKGAQMHRASHAPDLRAMWLALPESARSDVRQANGPRDREARAAQREERRARAAARQAELLALLRAPEFDAQAFSAMLMAEHLERSERIERAQQAFVARVSALDAAERALMAQRLEDGQREDGRGQWSSRR